MKRVFKSLFIVFMVLALSLSLFACSKKLKGTYTADGLIGQSFTFKEDNNVTFSAFGIKANGTYEIKDGKITITYSLLGLSYDMTKEFSQKGDSIFIDGTEYIKEK